MESFEFKIRASACSKIMGVKALGETGKSYCESALKEALYNRRTLIKSKYLEKGTLSEEDGFTLMALQLKLGMVFKNDVFFENEFIKGTPDLILENTVYDNKCSYSLDTFPMFDKEPDMAYWWQLQCYMDLTGCGKAVLAYTLIDAPIETIKQAIRFENDCDKIYNIVTQLVYTEKYFNELKEQFFQLSNKNYFIEIPAKERIKTFSFDYDKDAILKVRSRVLECRNYISSLLNN